MIYKLKSHYLKGSFSLFFMLIPTILLFLVVSVYPFIWTMRYVFYDYNGHKEYFIGIDNIVRLFTRDPIYWKSVINTFEYASLKLIFIVPISLVSAVLLNQKFLGNKIFKVAFFIPTVISAAVYSLIFYFIFSPYNGVLNSYLLQAGLISTKIDWLGNVEIVMKSIVAVAIWGGFGNYLILFLSGLQSIPEDIYESSTIDGANAIQNFWYITIPMLGPVLKVILMLAITTALKDYESILVLTNGGPQSSTQVMFLYIYQLMFGNEMNLGSLQIGYGATAGIVSSVIIGIITVSYLKLSKKLDDIY